MRAQQAIWQTRSGPEVEALKAEHALVLEQLASRNADVVSKGQEAGELRRKLAEVTSDRDHMATVGGLPCYTSCGIG